MASVSTTRWVEEGVAVYFEQAISERMRWQDTVALDNRVKEDLTSMKSFSARFRVYQYGTSTRKLGQSD